MISLRQLLVVALVTAGIWLLKHLQSRFMAERSRRRSAAAANSHPSTNAGDKDYQDMVLCQQCGVHIPRAEAVGNDRRGYKCIEARCNNQQQAYSAQDKA